jgi:hypothetical protein
MQGRRDVIAFLEDQPGIVPLLTAVARLGIDDCWIGAGLIRNAIWDHLHGFHVGLAAGSDVDVVYCDSEHSSLEHDLAIEARLRSKLPDIPWSVHNQARMPACNGKVYRNTEDAIRCWPETATAIAARTTNGRVEIMAPYGMDDLIGLIVRPTPKFMKRLPLYRERIASKGWARRWPKLRFLET